MTKKKLEILITNDDGIEATGIWHLWNALTDVANLSIVAPATEKSGVGVSLTLHTPLSIRSVNWEKKTPAWKINGTPVDCVRLAISVLDRKPDLIVSGINRGSNAGRNVLYSGTIGGVIEGALRGIPGIAFSCEDFDAPQYPRTEKYIKALVHHILAHPLPKGTLLNVNFPDICAEIQGIRLARQGKGFWVENPEKRVHPDGDPYYWHGGKWEHHEENEEGDVALLKKGYIAAVPISIEELTDHQFLSQRKKHFDDAFAKGV